MHIHLYMSKFFRTFAAGFLVRTHIHIRTRRTHNQQTQHHHMERQRIFISSVQSEFQHERKRLAEYIRTDALLGKFFVPFIFEQTENFKATLWRRSVCQDVGQDVAQFDVKDKKKNRYVQILTGLLTHRRMPLREVAEMVGVSERTINRDLKDLRRTYRIVWLGGPWKGRWEIEKLK